MSADRRPDRPNILYVFADQMRASAMGCMDDEAVQTPHLDGLAAQGVLFGNAFANTPVCTPSRGSLLTGKHALTCRCIVNDLRLPENEQSIADALKGHGYRTGYIGKWHLDGISRHMFTPPGRRRHGFDDYWAAYNCNHRYFDCRYYLDDSPELIREPGYDADVQTRQAIEFLSTSTSRLTRRATCSPGGASAQSGTPMPAGCKVGRCSMINWRTRTNCATWRSSQGTKH